MDIKRHPVTGDPLPDDTCWSCGADDETPHWLSCPLRLDRSASVGVTNLDSAYYGTWGVVDRQIGTTVYVSFDGTVLPFGRWEVSR